MAKAQPSAEEYGYLLTKKYLQSSFLSLKGLGVENFSLITFKSLFTSQRSTYEPDIFTL